MNTSYFARSSKLSNAVSITGKAPDWYNGKEYKKLAPKFWFFQKYKLDGDELFYRESYKKEVLDVLDAKQTYEELGDNAVLLCWEAPNRFCHRFIVADWFKEKLGIELKEI
jgi:hypothetical protein